MSMYRNTDYEKRCKIKNTKSIIIIIIIIIIIPIIIGATRIVTRSLRKKFEAVQENIR